MLDTHIQVPTTEGLHMVLVRNGRYSTVIIDPTFMKDIDSWGKKVLRMLEAEIKDSSEN